jgi:YesN/AraC family two-component response regulator
VALAAVLVVEDDRYVRSALRGLLENAGHEVEVAENGQVALEKLEDRPADLVITDILMPEKEGLETIREARARWPRLKIIAISGFLGFDFLKAAHAFGADEVMPKPVHPDMLIATVSKCLRAKASRTP